MSVEPLRCDTRAMATATAAQPHTRGTVLVVDDEPTIGEIVAKYLERAGYEAHTAIDGRGAMETFARVRPDLIVLDLMLPGIDGLEVMRRVREASERRTADHPPHRQGRGV